MLVVVHTAQEKKVDKPLLGSEANTKLLRENVLLIRGEVNTEMSDWVQDAIDVLSTRESPDIEVRISSKGGNALAGLEIYDMLQQYPGKKKGIVSRYAFSSAATILQACDTRQATRHSRFLIHFLTTGEMSLSDLMNKKKLEEKIRDGERIMSDIVRIYLRRSNLTRAALTRELRKDEDMFAPEALKLGLIDKII